jgi:hypothetical protein
MILISILDPGDGIGRRDFGGWSLLTYILFFIYGYVIMSNARLQQSIQRLRWFSLAGGVLGPVVALIVRGPSDPAFGTVDFVLLFSIYALVGWCWILAIMGFGMRHLTMTTPFLQYANEAVMPFYVMHQTVLLTVGYVVVQMPIPDLLKWAVIVVISLVIIMSLYEFLVRRFNVLRFLFGMKPLRPVTAPVVQPEPAASGK